MAQYGRSSLWKASLPTIDRGCSSWDDFTAASPTSSCNGSPAASNHQSFTDSCQYGGYPYSSPADGSSPTLPAKQQSAQYLSSFHQHEPSTHCENYDYLYSNSYTSSYQQEYNRNKQESIGHIMNQQQTTTAFTPQSFAVPISVRKDALKFKLAAAKTVTVECQQLQQWYGQQAAVLEGARYQELVAVYAMPWMSDSINRYYDYHHHCVISRVEQTLRMWQQSVKSASYTRCKVETDGESTDEILHSAYKQYVENVPSTIYFQNVEQQTQTRTKISSATITKTINKRRILKPRNTSCQFMSTFSPMSVRIMTNWYNLNRDRPYPSLDTCQSISESSGGDVTVEQVKKWFANRRGRDKNTKCMGEIAELRRNGRRKRSENSEEQDFMIGARKRLHTE